MPPSFRALRAFTQGRDCGGVYVSRAILRKRAGSDAVRPPRHLDYGSLARVGRAKAVAQFGPVHLTGLPARVLWVGAHIFFLTSFRNRRMVSATWVFAFATGRCLERLLAVRQLAGMLKGH